MAQTINTDERVLAFAVHDSINMFMRDVLIANQILSYDIIDQYESVIDAGLQAVVDKAIQNWKVSMFDE